MVPSRTAGGADDTEMGPGYLPSCRGIDMVGGGGGVTQFERGTQLLVVQLPMDGGCHQPAPLKVGRNERANVIRKWL